MPRIDPLISVQQAIAAWSPGDEDGPVHVVRALAEAWDAQEVVLYGVPVDGWCPHVASATRSEPAHTPGGISATLRNLSWFKGAQNSNPDLDLDRPDPYADDLGAAPRLQAGGWTKERVRPGRKPFIAMPLPLGDGNGGVLIIRLFPHYDLNAVLPAARAVAPFVSRVVHSWGLRRQLGRDLKQELRKNEANDETVQATFDTQAIVRILLRQLARSLNWETVLVCNEADDGFTLRFHEGLSDTLKDTDDLANQIIRRQQIGDVQLLLAHDPEKLRALGIRSVLVVPAAGAALVLLTANADAPSSQNQLRTMEAFAEQLDVVLSAEHQRDALAGAYLSTLEATVAALELCTPRLRGHHNQVVSWAEYIAQSLGLDDETIDQLRTAARVHDAGLLTDSTDPATATALQFQHPEIGEGLLGLLPNGAVFGRIVAEHHETYDGLGFPGLRQGEQLSVSGQVLAAAEFATEQTTVLVGHAASFQDLKRTFAKEENRRFRKDVAQAAVAAIDKRLAKVPRCRQLKGNPAGPCSTCPAATADVPCWELPTTSRFCGSHGDDACETCFVYRTWADTP